MKTIGYYMARGVMRYHTSPNTPRWTKRTLLYAGLWNWAFCRLGRG